MIIYGTCPGCGLVVDTTGGPAHANCPPVVNDLERKYRDALAGGDEALIEQLGPRLDERTAPRLREAALFMAGRWNWPVFPLVAGGKIPATRNGFKDATTDVERVAAWWDRHPDSNIGLPTGHAFDVYDIDTPKHETDPAKLAKRDKLEPAKRWAIEHGGWRSFWQLIDTDSIPAVHGVVSTAGGGLHLYVEPTGGGNLAGLLPGVDYRGAGGYVVAPPSTRTPEGIAYTWRSRPSPLVTQRKATQ